MRIIIGPVDLQQSAAGEVKVPDSSTPAAVQQGLAAAPADTVPLHFRCEPERRAASASAESVKARSGAKKGISPVTCRSRST